MEGGRAGATARAAPRSPPRPGPRPREPPRTRGRPRSFLQGIRHAHGRECGPVPREATERGSSGTAPAQPGRGRPSPDRGCLVHGCPAGPNLEESEARLLPSQPPAPRRPQARLRAAARSCGVRSGACSCLTQLVLLDCGCVRNECRQQTPRARRGEKVTFSIPTQPPVSSASRAQPWRQAGTFSSRLDWQEHFWPNANSHWFHRLLCPSALGRGWQLGTKIPRGAFPPRACSFASPRWQQPAAFIFPREHLLAQDRKG